MAKLTTEQLSSICDIIAEAFLDDTLGIIAHLNNTDKLDDFLKMTNLKGSVQKELERELFKTKKVLVVGEGRVSESDYKQKLRQIGIAPDNFEFFLDFKDGKNFDFVTYRNNPLYGGIIVGAMGHSGKSKGDYPSVIARIEKEPGFPMVVKCNDGHELNLSLNAFQSAVMQLFNAGVLQ